MGWPAPGNICACAFLVYYVNELVTRELGFIVSTVFNEEVMSCGRK